MENLDHIKKATPYKVINNVLFFLAQGIGDIFKDNLVGIYLTGSLSYGDFNKERSDIDLAVVSKMRASGDMIQDVKKLHEDAAKKFPKWAERTECSYIPLAMLENILPPKEPRLYLGAGKFCPLAKYGNEWIINQYFLYNHSIALFGPDFKTLVKPIKIEDVREANIRDLFEEWEPKIRDEKYLADSHQESYVVLNLCRILFAMKNEPSSKRVAAEWVKKEYPKWRSLIEEADAWHYGVEMKRQEEVKEFIKFAVDKVEIEKPA